MKIGAITYLSVLVAMVHLCCPNASGQDARARARRQLALRAAATEAFEFVEALSQTDESLNAAIVSMLSKTMLEDVAKYRTADLSRRECRDLAQRYKQDRIDARLADIVARAQSHSPEPIEMADLRDSLGSDWINKRNAEVSGYLDRFYGDIFESSRQMAVALQRERLAGMAAYPAFEPLDGMLTAILESRGNPHKALENDDFSSLQGRLDDRVLSEVNVFEEVEGSLRDLNEEVLRHIADQYRRQIAIVDETADHIPAGIVTESEIAQNIGAQLYEGIAPSPGPPPIYALFSVVEIYANETARNLESRRFAEFVSDFDQLDLEPAEAESLIAEDLERHRAYATSAAILTQYFAEKLSAAVADAYVGHKDAQLDAAELESLRKLLFDSALVAKAYAERVGGEVDGVLPGVRQGLALRQVNSALPEIFKDWDARTDVAEWLYERQLTAAQNLDQLADLVALIADRDVDRSALNFIAEAEELAVTTFNNRAAPVAAALAAQMRVVAEVERRHLPELKSSVLAGVRLRQILGQWRELWRELWAAEDESSVFRPMLRLADRQLEKNVRQHYDSIQEEIELDESSAAEIDAGIAAPTEEADSVEESILVEVVDQDDDTEDYQQVGENLVDGMSPGFGEMLAGLAGRADLILRFVDVATGKSVLEFASPSLHVGSTVEFDPAAVDMSGGEISAALEDLLSSIALAKADEQSGTLRIPFIAPRREPVISVYVSVESRNLRHVTIMRLRQALRNSLDTLSLEQGVSKFEIQWREWQREQ